MSYIMCDEFGAYKLIQSFGRVTGDMYKKSR